MNASKKAIYIADAIAARARFEDLPYIESIAPTTEGNKAICENWARYRDSLVKLGLYCYVLDCHERNFDKGLD